MHCSKNNHLNECEKVVRILCRYFYEHARYSTLKLRYSLGAIKSQERNLK